MFEPETFVVCIDDRFGPIVNERYHTLPVGGEIYQIRDVVPGIEEGGGATVSVYLHDLRNPPNKHGIEPGFHCRRFREVTQADHFRAYQNNEQQ